MIRPILIVTILSSLVVSGCATRQSYKTTNILGTSAWDVESNRLGERSGADFWWEQVTETNRYLVPLNGAKAAIVEGQKFERIDSDYVRRVALSQEKIAGGALQPGAIVVFRTARGRAGKLQVVGYKALHDFDFPEAASLTEAWKQFALSKPNIFLYHLQVRWTLLE
jgi:hypothetical protein